MIDETEVREAVLDALLDYHWHSDVQFGIAHLVWFLRENRVLPPNESREDQRLVLDVISDLVAERVLGWGSSIGPDVGPMAFAPWLHVRPTGRKVIQTHYERRRREKQERATKAAEAAK